MKSIINRLRYWECMSNFNFESIIIPQFQILWEYGIDILLNVGEGRVKELVLVMTWRISVLWQFSEREFKESQSWILVRQLLIVVMSEDGSVIFNCIFISSAYEWYVICEYLSKIEKVVGCRY